MNWGDLFAALAIVCVLEGMVPFVNPRGMRGVLIRLCDMTDRELRLGGFFSMLAGVVILFLVRS